MCLFQHIIWSWTEGRPYKLYKLATTNVLYVSFHSLQKTNELRPEADGCERVAEGSVSAPGAIRGILKNHASQYNHGTLSNKNPYSESGCKSKAGYHAAGLFLPRGAEASSAEPCCDESEDMCFGDAADSRTISTRAECPMASCFNSRLLKTSSLEMLRKKKRHWKSFGGLLPHISSVLTRVTLMRPWRKRETPQWPSFIQWRCVYLMCGPWYEIMNSPRAPHFWKAWTQMKKLLCRGEEESELRVSVQAGQCLQRSVFFFNVVPTFTAYCCICHILPWWILQGRSSHVVIKYILGMRHVVEVRTMIGGSFVYLKQ